MKKDRSSIIKTASIIAFFGNLLLAVLKIWSGLYAGSLAVLGDGIDSSMDVFIAAMTLIVSGVISKPADKDHPWGHGRAETIATVILSMLLFFAGGQLILNSIQQLIAGAKNEIPGTIALVATIISILGKILLSWSQHLLGNKTGSAMLKANAKNMVADVFTSLGVLIGLFISIFFNIGSIDLVVAILVGLWIIKNAVNIFLETNMELMDGTKNDEIYKLLFEVIRSVPEVSNPHRTRMRCIAGFWDIVLDIEVNPDLSVTQAHEIATKLENTVKARIDNIFDIMVHVEPIGNKQIEAYGLREE